MKRCKRCIMPDTVPGIRLDPTGLCNYCLDYKKEEPLGAFELDKIFDEAKKKGSKYDCIVPVSGGRDSTYILYLAKAVYGLNALAVNYDNEFATKLATDNLKRACDLLQVHLVQVCSRMNIAKKIARSNIRAATEFGHFRECAACTYGYKSIVYKTAREKRIPLILWGEAKEESTMAMELAAFEAIRNHKRKYIKLFKYSFYKAEFYRLLQRLEFYYSWKNILNRGFDPIFSDKDIREIRVFDYITWNRGKIKETIIKELGWERPSDQISTWKTDCAMIALTNYYYIKLFGCTKTCFGYCKMINSGQMERWEALEQEEEALINYSRNIRELLESKIGLPKKEVDKIISGNI